VRPDRARDRTADQPKADERESHAALPGPGGSDTAATPTDPAFGQAALAGLLGWTGVVWWLLAADQGTPLELAPVVTEIGAAPRAATFLGEQ
jgi:hypothetical protein